ncbi:hypothetical protein PS15p_205483 [Mucor circinelloides]
MGELDGGLVDNMAYTQQQNNLEEHFPEDGIQQGDSSPTLLRNLSIMLITPPTAWTPTLLNEDLLCISFYYPIVVGPFLNKLPNASCHGNNKEELRISKRRKVSQRVGLMMIEMEAPSQSKGRPDLVKLAALMEDSCDQVLSNQCVRYRYFSPGLLQDATNTSLFVMNLPSDYFYVFAWSTNFSYLLLPLTCWV